MPKRNPPPTEPKKTYSAPKLTNHGRITQLTTGGSGMMMEMGGMPAMQTMRFP